MALTPEELAALAEDILPDDLPDDPEQSYCPSSTKFPRREPPSDAKKGKDGTVVPAKSLPQWTISQMEFPMEVFEDEEIEPMQARPGCAEYILRQIVGTGGFGEVWEATQGALGRVVAVKKMRDDLRHHQDASTGEASRMEDDFTREALTTAMLEHPNIVPVHDLGLDDSGKPLLAMKLLRGERWDLTIVMDFDDLTVQDFLAKHLPIFLDVCNAVAFAHSRGIVHRDLKPSQVIVGEFGETILMDWGLAVLAQPEKLDGYLADLVEQVAPRLDIAFNPTGTPAYMAPEQTLKHSLEIDPRTDVYLLGGTLYYLLTRRAPHQSAGTKEAFLSAMQGTVKRPEYVISDRDVPKDLAEIAMKALAPKKEDRYPSAKELIAAVENFMTGADNRRESREIVDAVREEMSVAATSYDKLNERNSRIMRALALWPQNPEAQQLLNRHRQQFAEIALQNHDIVLARLMAEACEEGEKRARLLKQIEGEERQGQRVSRQRRMLWFVSSILIAIIIFDIIYLLFLSGSATTSNLKQELIATEKRAIEAEQRATLLQRQLDEIAPPPDRTPPPRKTD